MKVEGPNAGIVVDQGSQRLLAALHLSVWRRAAVSGMDAWVESSPASRTPARVIVRAWVNPIAVSGDDPGAVVHQPKSGSVDGLASGVGPIDGFQGLGKGEGLVIDEVNSLFRVWGSRVRGGEDGAGGGHHPIREVRLSHHAVNGRISKAPPGQPSAASTRQLRSEPTGE
jgi:hypothetical protein